MKKTKPANNGYKMFVIRGLWIKANKPMPFKEFLKSGILKEMILERKGQYAKDSQSKPEKPSND